MDVLDLTCSHHHPNGHQRQGANKDSESYHLPQRPGEDGCHMNLGATQTRFLFSKNSWGRGGTLHRMSFLKTSTVVNWFLSLRRIFGEASQKTPRLTRKFPKTLGTIIYIYISLRIILCTALIFYFDVSVLHLQSILYLQRHKLTTKGLLHNQGTPWWVLKLSQPWWSMGPNPWFPCLTTNLPNVTIMSELDPSKHLWFPQPSVSLAAYSCKEPTNICKESSIQQYEKKNGKQTTKGL